MSKTVQRLRKEMSNLDDKRKQVSAQLKQAYASKTFPCVCCGKRHQFKRCDAVQTHWYEKPYSCSGGDHWYESELWILCPTTQNYNRMLFLSDCVTQENGKRTNYNGAFKMRYKSTFKSIRDTYRDEPNNWRNNEHIDQHAKEYGLDEPLY